MATKPTENEIRARIKELEKKKSKITERGAFYAHLSGREKELLKLSSEIKGLKWALGEEDDDSGIMGSPVLARKG